MQISYLPRLRKQTSNSQSVFLVYAYTYVPRSTNLGLSYTNLSRAYDAATRRWKVRVERQLDSDSVCSDSQVKVRRLALPSLHILHILHIRIRWTKGARTGGLCVAFASHHWVEVFRSKIQPRRSSSETSSSPRKKLHLPPAHRVTFLYEDRLLIFGRDNVDVVFYRDFQQRQVVVCRWPSWRPLHHATEVYLCSSVVLSRRLLSFLFFFLFSSSSFAIKILRSETRWKNCSRDFPFTDYQISRSETRSSDWYLIRIHASFLFLSLYIGKLPFFGRENGARVIRWRSSD